MGTLVKPVGRVKTRPEDFVVTEVVNGREVGHEFTTKMHEASSPLSLFSLTKRGIGGEPAYREVARRLGVAREHVSDHGLKDACAVTSQQIVVEGAYDPHFEHDQLWLRYIGPASGRLRHGGHDGNRFSIVVYTDAVHPPEADSFLNLFGSQRFGDGHLEVGKFLYEGNYKEALRHLEGSMNWRVIEGLMSRGMTAEEALLHPSFRFELKFKLLQWQSHLWNLLARRTTEMHLPTWSVQYRRLYEHLWNPKTLDETMLSLSYSFIRRVQAKVSQHRIIERDEGFVHQFMLGSGSYATVLLSSLYELEDVSRTKFSIAA